MKVITPGREQKGWAREFACTGKGNGDGGCGAKLLVEEADVFQTHSSHYDGSTDHYRTFRCSLCGCKTDLPETVVLPFTPPDREREVGAATPGGTT